MKGLTSDELFAVFNWSFTEQIGVFIGRTHAIEENPEFRQQLDAMQEKLPDVPAGVVIAMYCFVMAIMDTIAANNTALAN